jgi:chemotaxis protein histidine kinase CheA
VHTFKGSFSQMGFYHLPLALHTAEDSLRPAHGAPAETLDEALAHTLFAVDWLTTLERDMLELEQALGHDFIERHGTVPLSLEHAQLVQNMARQHLQQHPSADAAYAHLARLLHLNLHDALRSHERMMQRLAKDLGKTLAPLVVEGDPIWLEPEPYRALLASLVHAFRNAVDHGIEDPEAREEAENRSRATFVATPA